MAPPRYWQDDETWWRRGSDRALPDPLEQPHLPLEMRSPGTWPGWHRGRTPANKGKRYPVELLTPDEVRRLVVAADDGHWVGCRNQALIVLMYRTGVRINEARHLAIKDFDLEFGMIAVLFGKYQTSRSVGMDEVTSRFVKSWITTHQRHGFDRSGPLFCTGSGRMVAGAYVRQLLPRLAGKAGIEKRVHSHGLRHAFAFEQAMEGVPLPIIRAQLGHLWSTSTEAYLAHIAPMEAIQATRSRTWACAPQPSGDDDARRLYETPFWPL